MAHPDVTLGVVIPQVSAPDLRMNAFKLCKGPEWRATVSGPERATSTMRAT